MQCDMSLTLKQKHSGRSLRSYASSMRLIRIVVKPITLIIKREMTSQSSSPYRLVSLNTSPERAKKVIGGVIENVKEKYSIVHVGNAECKSKISTRG